MDTIAIYVHVTAADAVLGDGRHGYCSVRVELDQLTAEQRKMLAHLVREQKGDACLRQPAIPCLAGEDMGVSNDVAEVRSATHEAVVEYLDECLEKNERLLEKRRQAEAERRQAEAERRAEAERQAALPIAEQVRSSYAGQWSVVHPLCLYDDLAAPAQAERQTLEAHARETAAKQREQQEQREKERAERRARTLRAWLISRDPDLVAGLDDGTLAERSVVDPLICAVRDRVGSQVSLFAVEAGHRWIDYDIEALPAGPWKIKQALDLEELARDLQGYLGIDGVRITGGDAERRVIYRPADDDDEPEDIDDDGEVIVETRYAWKITADVGGIIAKLAVDLGVE